jgi:hypothetical protein
MSIPGGQINNNEGVGAGGSDAGDGAGGAAGDAFVAVVERDAAAVRSEDFMRRKQTQFATTAVLMLADSAERAAATVADRLQREAAALDAQAALTALGMKLQTSKELAKYLAAVVSIAVSAEQRVLATCIISAQGILDAEATDIEEASTELQAGIKKLTSLSADKQDEMMKRLKIKKRTVEETCTRCNRTHHIEANYNAKQTVAGVALEPRGLRAAA